jgi:hypothetical protein
MYRASVSADYSRPYTDDVTIILANKHAFPVTYLMCSIIVQIVLISKGSSCDVAIPVWEKFIAV